MRIYMRSNVVWVAVVLLTVVLSPGRLQAQHPFLLVTEANYPTLRALASQSPWSDMKAAAISSALNLNYDPGAAYEDKARRMGDIVSAGALAYILDPGNSSTYKDKVRDTIVNYWPDLRAGLNKGDHARTVPPGTAFFKSVLALDIIYNDLTPTELANVENELQLVADWYNSNNTSWRLNLYGVRGIWAIYANDRPRIDTAKSDYRNELMSQLSEDGVINHSVSYAGARLGYTRAAKAHFMDVLEFTAEDPNYYSDSTIQAFMEWMYGYSVTPFRLHYTFGDAPPNRNRPQRGPGQYRTHRFSAAAEKYAAYNNNEWPPPGRLLYYIFMTQPWPAPEKAPSRIFPDGGAWFNQVGNSERDLSGALWNQKSSGGHSHKETNAVHLCAYGEHVLRNSGYAGWSKGVFGFTWEYIHDFAESGNTVLIDGTDHNTKVGAGLTEGFTASGFGYASGDSGNALPNGHHQRNFLFIHPNGSVNGYWVLFDEVDANSSSAQVNVALHPNSDDCNVVSAGQEYEWMIAPYPESGHDVNLSIFLGTAPASTSIKNGLLASYDNESFVGEYLYSTYDTDGSGYRNIVTVLFPHDANHTKATMTRISGTGCTGASIVQSDVNDIALESTGASQVTHGNVAFEGLATWYRLDANSPTSYFVRKGDYFDDGSTPSVGFSSDANVSIYMDGPYGRIVSPGTNVTFYYPGILGVSLNGSPLPNVDLGTDWAQVDIPSGTHEVQLEFGLIFSPDIDSDDDVDLEDFAILASQWRQAPGVPSADIAPGGGDGIVDTLDLAVLATYWLEGVGPPTPDPMTWATVPYATSSTSIAMVATTASDPAGVEYYFVCTAGGGHDSGWQDSTSYEDTGLNPSTTYTYQAKARDKSPNQNETGFSTPESATTEPLDTTPPTPNPMTWATAPYATGSSSIAMVATTATDASGVEYYFDETSGNPGGSDSGWQDSTSYEDTGLDPETTYTYQVKARDKSPSQNETAFSTAESATTDVAGPTLLFSDTFPVYGDFATGGWTTGGDSTNVNSQCACEGENGANLKKSSWMEKALSTVGYTDIQVKYVRSTSNFDGDTTTGEYLLVEWYDGSSWNELERTQVGSCGYVTWTCGSGANDNASWKVRFITNADANNERGCVDDVEIWGTPIP